MKLDEKELKMCEKTIKEDEEKIEKSKDKIEMYEKQQKFLIIKREHEDYLRPINRETEDEEIELAIKRTGFEKEMAEREIKILKEKIKNGKKLPTGVN